MKINHEAGTYQISPEDKNFAGFWQWITLLKALGYQDETDSTDRQVRDTDD